MEVLTAFERVNERQKGILFRKLDAFYGGNLAGRTVALWGLAFKPETDDMREAPSLVTLDLLLEAGRHVSGNDTVAISELGRRLGSTVTYGSVLRDVVHGGGQLQMSGDATASHYDLCLSCTKTGTRPFVSS